MEHFATLSDWLSPALQSISQFWNLVPEMVKYAGSALFGAFVNGCAAARRQLMDELRALSTAHALCFTIANNALSLKKQYIHDIKFAYESATELYEAHMCDPSGVLAVSLDLQSLSEVFFPSSHLEKLVCEKLFLGAQGVAAAITLSGAINSLLESIRFRNALAAEFQSRKDEADLSKISRYLGVVFEGNCDQRFRNNIEALYQLTNDCIFFAQHLSEIIVTFENKLRRRNWYYYLPGKKLLRPDWTEARASGLIPAETAYADWTRGFVQRPSTVAAAFLALKQTFKI